MTSRRALKDIRKDGRRVPATVVGVQGASATVLLREEGQIAIAHANGRVIAEPAREVIVRWHPGHREQAVLDEDHGDPWLLVGTSAAATVLDSEALGHDVHRHRLEIRPAASGAHERHAITLGRLPAGSIHEAIWDPGRDEALVGPAVNRVNASRREILATEGVRAPAIIVSVTDTRRRDANGRPELVIVTEVRPADGTPAFRIAKRGAWNSAKSIGQPATAVFHPRARHLHVLTFVD